VLVFDERGAGNGWLLPAGPLREPMPHDVPARSLVLYNADVASTKLPGHLARRSLGGLVDLAQWWDGRPPDPAALERLKGRAVVAAAGVARPQRFFDMLRANGLTIETLALPDHHDFETLPWPAHAEDVIVTEKDAVKLKHERMGRTRVWVAALDFDIGEALTDELLALLPPPTVHRPEMPHGSPIA
jgi:tetraacyldisaccharide 4'-kinase